MARNVNSQKALFDDLQFDRIGTSSQNDAIPERDKPAVIAGTQKKEEPRRDIADDWKDKMSVKKTFFFTPKNLEALKLRHAICADSAREFSRILNDALSQYLEPEIKALEEAEASGASAHERYFKALSILMGRGSE